MPRRKKRFDADVAREAAPGAVQPNDPRGGDASLDPDPEAEAAELDVAMLEEPTHLPGRPRANFSPGEFYALAGITRTDVRLDDDALWLHEEPCPTVTPEGINVHGRLYFHADLMPYVRVPMPARRGKKESASRLVIRYDRALLARGVLDEVRVYEKDAGGRYTECCRCKPRDRVLHELDRHQVLRERDLYVEALVAKVNRAHELRITLQHGREALERLLDAQAARAQWRRRGHKEPIMARPIFGLPKVEVDRQQAEAATHQLVDHIKAAQHENVTESDGLETDGAAAPTESGSPRRGPTKATRTRRRGRHAADTVVGSVPGQLPASGAAPTTTGQPPAATAVETTPSSPAASDAPHTQQSNLSLASYLGGSTGFLDSPDDPSQ